MSKFGWKKQPVDSRDVKFMAKRNINQLPVAHSLHKLLPKVLDQGDIGSCTAHGITGALWVSLLQNSKEAFQASRLFVYYEERVIDGTINEDCGAYIRDGIKVINSKGAPYESLWEYDTKRFAEMPPQEAYENARLHRALKYEAVQNTRQDFMNAIYEGTCVVFGFMCYESLNKIKANGLMPNPKRGEKIQGGHCVYAYGYDAGGVWCRNSWSDQWGKKGDFRISWSFLTSSKVADCWRILLT